MTIQAKVEEPEDIDKERKEGDGDALIFGSFGKGIHNVNKIDRGFLRSQVRQASLRGCVGRPWPCPFTWAAAAHSPARLPSISRLPWLPFSLFHRTTIPTTVFVVAFPPPSNIPRVKQ